MKIGMVCPYDWGTPGGVRSHVQGLATTLQSRGHEVSVLTPVEDEACLPDWAVPGGKPITVSYNGAVAGLSFGVRATRRVRRWIRDGQFDVLHVHEPLAPSLSILSCWSAQGPIVGTWHSSLDRSRILSAGYSIAQTAMEKISASIAVSEDARRTLVTHVGGDAVLIPNGVRTADFRIEARSVNCDAPTLLFLGRLDEPRKGLDVLIGAIPQILTAIPTARVLIAGPGDTSEHVAAIPAAMRGRVEIIGNVSDEGRREIFARSDLYVAPHMGGESFGIVLIEAMAASTPVLASDLPAFRRVLQDGQSGMLFTTGDASALAASAVSLLNNATRRSELSAAGLLRAQAFDWEQIVDDVLAVYDSVRLPDSRVQEDLTGQLVGRLRTWRS
jgi:phosphatidylinositol alpha-mannosyltransferase